MIPLGEIGRMFLERRKGTIYETEFVFGVLGLSYGLLPFIEIVSCKESKNKYEVWRVEWMNKVDRGNGRGENHRK